MKGLVLLFLTIVFGMIGWRYVDAVSKKDIQTFISQNLAALILGFLAVAVAVLISTNTTLRLV